MHGLFKDLKDKKFGILTVLRLVKTVPDSRGHNQHYWLCVCECLNKVVATGRNLRRGHKKSCGCRKTEGIRVAAIAKRKPDTYLNALIKRYKYDANKRGLSFSISKKKFSQLVSSNCFYCGSEPTIAYNPYGKTRNNYNPNFFVNGLDRVDNSKGYTTSNVVPSCKGCNYAKRTMSKDEFLELVKKIYEKHWGGKT